MVRDLALDMNSSFASQLRYMLSCSGVFRKFRECGLRRCIGATGNTVPAAEAPAVSVGQCEPTKSGAGDGNRTHAGGASEAEKQALWRNGESQV